MVSYEIMNPALVALRSFHWPQLTTDTSNVVHQWRQLVKPSVCQERPPEIGEKSWGVSKSIPSDRAVQKPLRSGTQEINENGLTLDPNDKLRRTSRKQDLRPAALAREKAETGSRCPQFA